nr:uncharacterized protein LOC117274578 [Nicotiana tomentosiformis]
MRMQAARYNIIHNDLYKRTYGSPLAKCLGQNQTPRILEEVHEVHCAAHSGNRSLVRCLIRAGYYWPTMKKEVTDFMKTYEQCQKYAPMIQQAGEHLHSVIPLSRSSNGEWTSWAPSRQDEVAVFYEKWYIKRILSTPYHPAGNGQAEYSNKSILNIMKKKLEDAKGLWPKILPEVLWVYRTMPKTSTGETPYSLVYGTNAEIPVEVEEPSLRYSHESEPRNDESRRQELDEVEERRDMAYFGILKEVLTRQRRGHLKPKYTKAEHKTASSLLDLSSLLQFDQ